ncbi:hypothetical protein K439DRAFT_1074193 [Ramaria rubella]|nr:hypothetical protein K439DRAFT_1074193 [Ramaria rubella]
MTAILDLPLELLDLCLSLLLPTLDDQPFLTHRLHMPTPHDLLQCRLVCQTFQCLASHWVWKRVHLRLMDPSVSDIPASSLTDAVAKCAFFVDHPQFASQVHVLSVKCALPIGTLRSISRSLTPALQKFTNIRFFILHNIYDEIDFWTDILHQPRLHTLVMHTAGYFSGLKSLVNLKHLHVTDVLWTALDIPDSLQSLVFSCQKLPQAQFDFTTLKIPWATLRQLEVDGIEGCACIAQAFSAWKQKYGEISPLEELSVSGMGDHLAISNVELERLLATFSCQPIRHLILLDVPDLDVQLIETIVTRYPGLEDLLLFTQGCLTPWDGGLVRRFLNPGVKRKD